MNTIEKCLLAMILTSALLVTVSQAYHYGYRQAVIAHGECESNQE